MTVTTVGELIEALKRFNPLAKLSEEIEIDGVAPDVTCEMNHPMLQILRDKVDRLEDQLDDTADEVGALEAAESELKQYKKTIADHLEKLASADRYLRAMIKE